MRGKEQICQGEVEREHGGGGDSVCVRDKQQLEREKGKGGGE